MPSTTTPEKRKSPTQVDALETLFKALADRTRLRILALLGAGEICVCHVHESLRIPQPKASRHLAYLKRAGLVQDRKQGLWVHYRLTPPADPVVATVLRAVAHALGHVSSTGRDLRRLKQEAGVSPPAAVANLPVPACCGPVATSHEPAEPNCC